MPQARRQEPLHLQIAGYYKKEITEGRLHYRDRLPSIRDIRRSWTDSDGGPIGQNTAQRAIEYLRTEGLVTTGSEGTFVAEPRAAIGPQQRMRLAAVPVSERQQVTAAGAVTCPDYILPVLGLEAGAQVVRREWVTWEGEVPVRLSVSWNPVPVATLVPELLSPLPLPDPRGAAALVTERAGRDVAALAGYTAFECRPVRDDYREAPLLELGEDAHVLAGVWTWRDGEAVIEYGEYILPPGRVIESTLEP